MAARVSAEPVTLCRSSDPRLGTGSVAGVGVGAVVALLVWAHTCSAHVLSCSYPSALPRDTPINEYPGACRKPVSQEQPGVAQSSTENRVVSEPGTHAAQSTDPLRVLRSRPTPAATFTVRNASRPSTARAKEAPSLAPVLGEDAP